MQKRRIIIGSVMGIIIIIIDQLSKLFMINKNFDIIPGFLNFSYVQNKGAAFGIGNFNIVLIFNILIIIGVIIVLLKYNKKINNYIPYILVLSGGIGNLIDRIFRGYVIDFIDVNLFNFPTFNIADICIVVGIFWICIKIILNNIKR